MMLKVYFAFVILAKTCLNHIFNSYKCVFFQTLINIKRVCKLQLLFVKVSEHMYLNIAIVGNL